MCRESYPGLSIDDVLKKIKDLSQKPSFTLALMCFVLMLRFAPVVFVWVYGLISPYESPGRGRESPVAAHPRSTSELLRTL